MKIFLMNLHKKHKLEDKAIQAVKVSKAIILIIKLQIVNNNLMLKKGFQIKYLPVQKRFNKHLNKIKARNHIIS